MNLLEYSTWLIEFSNKYQIKEENKLVVYIAGLIEELNEYANVADDELSKKKELGDLLAYLILTSNYVGFPIIKLGLTNAPISVSQLSMQMAGFLKRLYRGDYEPTQCGLILLNFIDFIVSELMKLNITSDELIEINYNKLTERNLNNTLKGNGDDR